MKFVECQNEKASGHRLLIDALSLMIRNIETPLTSREISIALRTTSRSLERNFYTAFKEGPMKVYRILRLERAYQLLRYSDIPLIEVSLAAGFGSVSSLSQWYCRQYNQTPTASRAFRYQR